ncbi:MAG: glycosyltransferase family 4 protein [Candidatus Omnitrophota bacterium]
MKIAHIGSRGFPGFNAGVEKCLEEICPRLMARGHDVTIYCSEEITTAEPIYKNTIVRRTSAIATKHLETLSRVALAAWKSIFEAYDIVHFHSIGPALLSWLPRFGHRKTVVTVHGLDWQRAKWGPLARWTLKAGEASSVLFPDHTIVVSKYLHRYFAEQHHRQVTYIPNGVTLYPRLEPNLIREKWGLGSGDYILFAARLTPEKECHTLIEAYKKISTDKKLVIAGSNWHSEGYEAQLHRQARGHSGILFAGWVEGDLMRELYSNAYLFCLPSTIEGLSLALLEAMSYGVCSLVSNITENLDVIENYGVSFETENVTDLRVKLEALLNDPEKVGRVGCEARRHVAERYSWDDVTAELEKVYLNLLTSSPRKTDMADARA